MSNQQRNTVAERITLLSLVDMCMNGLEAEDEFDDWYGCFDRGTPGKSYVVLVLVT
jgi:hypothetical protein